MKTKTILSVAFSALALCGAGAESNAQTVTPEGKYIEHKVDAPFQMPILREFVYPERDFDIRKYGAKQGKLCTDAIAKAITACNKAGGGRVVIPEGEWTTGAVHLKSNVDLHLSEGSVLVFTDDPADYLPAVMTSWEGLECYNYSPLVYAFECENVAITGSGTLAPKMDLWRTWFARPEAHLEALKRLYCMASSGVSVQERQMAVGENNMRPHLIQFNRCKGVLLDGFKIRESPFWTIHMYMCKGGIARNLDVYAHGHNNDGIDLEMTSEFLVENCKFDQGDDAVVIKSGRNQDAWRLATPTEKIVVRNCTIINGHTLLGVGSEISGGVRDVYMHDCSASDVYRFFFVKTNHRRGGFVDNVIMSDVSSGNTQRLLEIDTEVLYQWKDLVPTFERRQTRISNIIMRGVSCKTTDAVYELKGSAELPIKGVTIEDVKVEKVRDFYSRVNNVEDLKVSGIEVGE